MMNGTLGNLLRDARAMYGITMRKAAYDMGIYAETLCKIELGDRLPSEAVLRRAAQYYDIPMRIMVRAFAESAGGRTAVRGHPALETPEDGCKTALGRSIRTREEKEREVYRLVYGE